MYNTRGMVCAVIAILVACVSGVGCQQQRVRDPRDVGRQILGPFAVHLAYTDGQTIFGRSAPTVAGLAAATTETLLDPVGSVEGLSMAFFKNRRRVAWLDSGGIMHTSIVPGTATGSVVVDPRPSQTRPGLAATADRLYLSASEENFIRVFSSADGSTWELEDSVVMPFDVGATDIVAGNNHLWIAVTTRDGDTTDHAMLVSVRLNASGDLIAGDPEFHPITSFPPAIDGRRGIRLVGSPSAFAVACLSRPFQFPIGGPPNRETLFAVSDPGDEFHVSWSRGSDGGRVGGSSCPAALIFVPRATDASGPATALGVVSPSGFDSQQQSFSASQSDPPYYSGQEFSFQQFTRTHIKDAALAAGREAKSVRIEIRDDLRR